MNITIENILLIGSFLLFVSVIAGKTSFRFGIPTLILFLIIGMLAGSDGIGGIYFNNPIVAKFIGIVSLNFILFSGGLDTNWNTIKPVVWQGFSLSTIGVLITAVSLGTFIWFITDFSIYESMLLGSIVSSTDAAAVFSILRSKSIALKGHLRPTLELESGSNDPMAYALTIAFLSLVVNQDQSLLSVIPTFLIQMIIGGALGYFWARVSKFTINHIKLDYEGLYPVLAISLMFLTYASTDYLGGNGFLAVYLNALYLGNQILTHKKTIIKMFDGSAWLMQIILFLTLGLLVYPSQILQYAGIGITLSFFLIIVARPLSVLVSLLPFRMALRKRFFISWVGLKGAVPIVFATFAMIQGIEKANIIFNIVFFISVTSIILQGTTLGLVAKWFHVSLPEKLKPRVPYDLILSERVNSVMEEIHIPPNSFPVGKKIIDLNIPQAALIAMINRNNSFITPNGSTIIESDDILIVLADCRSNLEKAHNNLRLFETKF